MSRDIHVCSEGLTVHLLVCIQSFRERLFQDLLVEFFGVLVLRGRKCFSFACVQFVDHLDQRVVFLFYTSFGDDGIGCKDSDDNRDEDNPQ